MEETYLIWVALRLARKPVTVALVTTCFGLGTGEASAEELKMAMAPRRVENCIFSGLVGMKWLNGMYVSRWEMVSIKALTD